MSYRKIIKIIMSGELADWFEARMTQFGYTAEELIRDAFDYHFHICGGDAPPDWSKPSGFGRWRLK